MHVTLHIDTRLSITELAGILRTQLPPKERQELVDLLQADDEISSKEQTKMPVKVIELASKRYEEEQLTAGIQRLSAESGTFNFLDEEEELYSIADLKQVYNG